MPQALGIVLLIVALAIAARAWLARAAPVVETETGDDGRLPRVLGLLACAGLYIFAAWLAGYIVATFIAILAVSVYEGAPLNVRTLGVAAVGAALFWLLFVKLLNVAQPVGLLFGG